MLNITQDIPDTVIQPVSQPSDFDEIVRGRRRDDSRPVSHNPRTNFRVRRTAKHVSRRSEMGALRLAADRVAAFCAGVCAGIPTALSLGLLAASVALGAMRRG